MTKPTFSDALTFQEATYADMAECAEVFNQAFATDPNFRFFFDDTVNPKDVIAKDTREYQSEYRKAGRRFFKIVDEANGKIAGFSKWWFPHKPVEEREELPKDFIPGTNVALITEFFSKMVDGRVQHIKNEDMYFVNILAVRPEYQRKGLGGRLLQPILDIADKEQRKTYIEASIKGIGLYKKMGWVEIGEIMIDQRPHGGSGVERTGLLMREPQAKS